MKELPKKYDHQATEKKWQKHWLEQQTYQWDATIPREDSYVIDTPPPTVSGLLHMGHVFSYTQADFIARFQRMNGKNVFYPMGFDDNGLPTERLVEKTKKIRAVDVGREEFITLCETVGEEARKDFRELFQSIALSVDWQQEYHTVSEDSRRISQLSFLDLLAKGKAYRKLQPMLWDPVDQTAIAQAEIEDKEKETFENYIHFGLISEAKADSNDKPSWGKLEKVEIMTTRPELLAACVALMCHPDDEEKYQGKYAVTPLFNVIVPIVADEKVDKEKGTGLVMCCTYGDETDIEWQRKYRLPVRCILNEFGRISFIDDVPSPVVRDRDRISEKFPPNQIAFPHMLEGHVARSAKQLQDPRLNEGNTLNIETTRKYINELKINEQQGKKVTNPNKDKEGNFLGARETIIELLQLEGCFVKNEDDTIKQNKITHTVKCAERSGAELEYLPSTQWFVKILDQKEELKAKAAECNWYPSYMKVRVDQWIDGLSWDWCISRQRYFGVPFPVWYSKRAGEEGKILVADIDQLPVNPLVDLPKGYSADEVEREADVMDTWATSSVSPQLSSGAITKEYAVDYARHQQLFPADLRPQAHEIIRTWAFYTIAKSHLHENTIPWKNLMISGWCLAADKTKMSKSKGNVVTPVDLIENKGSDVVRYWASTSHLGADTAYSEDVLKIGNKLINKLWNATKFAAIHLDKLEGTPTTSLEDIKKGIIAEAMDIWVLSRLADTVSKATEAFHNYEYCRAREAIELFFWNDFCDNYLEITKVRAYGEADSIQPHQQQSALYTIYHSVETFLRLFAPFVPHITEELYSHIFDHQTIGSIHQKDTWPLRQNYAYDEQADAAGKSCVALLDAVRKLKAEKNVSIKWPLTHLYIALAEDKEQGADQTALLDVVLDDLKHVTNTAEIIWAESLPEGIDSLKTEDTPYVIGVKFAEKSDAA